ncbi:hypothetical protein BJX76DRAFT_328868 [Aspergillus varians]
MPTPSFGSPTRLVKQPKRVELVANNLLTSIQNQVPPNCITGSLLTTRWCMIVPASALRYQLCTTLRRDHARS